MSGVLHGVIASLKTAVASVTDAYFKYVSLLLNTTSTNGAQNNTFLDSSANAFSVTRNGDTTQGSFNPYMPTGYWSGYFDGSGDSLTLASNAAFGLGTGDFTIEMWVYATANPANGPGAILDLRTGATATATSVRIDSSLNVLFYDGPSNLAINVGTITLNTWTHIAHVRASGSLKTYFNGTLSNTTPLTSNLGSNQPCIIGNSQAVGYAWNGYLSNLRIVKGTAVYTSDFTPLSTPLTAITNTSLLCLQDNRFIDNSSNAFAITRNGDTRISKFAPFNPPASYSTATYGGSGYFDGGGDYLTLPNNAAFNISTGDFTIECWFNTGVANSNYQRILGLNAGSSIPTETLAFEINSAGILIVAVSGSTSYGGTTATPLPPNTWNHLALVRNGSNITGYVNGVSIGSSTFAGSLNYASGAFFQIGYWQTNTTSRFITGYMSSLRFVKGTAVYTANFTPPTSPLTAISGTSVLLNFDNAGIYDAATINTVRTVGNAQVSTTQAKFGTTSIYCDGSGDYGDLLSVPENTVRTGAFTLETWAYLATADAGTERYIFFQYGPGIVLGVTAGNYVFGGTYLTLLQSANTIPLDQWVHIALVREGTGASQFKLYVNGVLEDTGTSTRDVTQNFIRIGATNTGTSPWKGYLDEMRMTNGYARYTAAFTPPTAAFPTL